jgi:hypothetical protein
VRPLFRGRKLVAAAFVSDIYIRRRSRISLVVWKYVEVQTEGYVRNLLYKGIDARPAGLFGERSRSGRRLQGPRVEEWDHRPGHAGRAAIANKFGR